MPPDFEEDLRRRLLISLGPREALAHLQGGTPLVGDFPPRVARPLIDIDRVAQDVEAEFWPTLRAGLGAGIAGGTGLAGGLMGLPLLGEMGLGAIGGALGESIATRDITDPGSVVAHGAGGAMGGAVGPLVGRGLGWLGGKAYRGLRGLLSGADDVAPSPSMQPLVAPPEQYGGLGGPGVAPSSAVDDIGLVPGGTPPRYGLFGSDVQPGGGQPLDASDFLEPTVQARKPGLSVPERAGLSQDPHEDWVIEAFDGLTFRDVEIPGEPRFSMGNLPDAEARRVMGFLPDEAQWRDLTGIPQSASMSMAYMGRDYLNATGLAEGLFIKRTFGRTMSGDLFIKNEIMEIPPFSPPGTGTKMFARQAFAASKAGVKFIRAQAAGQGPRAYGVTGRDLSNEWNGYYTWARLGYDATIELPEAMRAPFGGAETVKLSEIMATPEGRAFWKEYGFEYSAKFDLAPDSYSMRTLRAYIEEISQR